MGQVCCSTLGTLALGRWKPEDQEFKVICGHKISLSSNLLFHRIRSQNTKVKNSVNQVVKMAELHFNFRSILFCILCMCVSAACVLTVSLKSSLVVSGVTFGHHLVSGGGCSLGGLFRRALSPQCRYLAY